MNKKILSALSVVLLVVSFFSGCGGDSNNTQPQATAPALSIALKEQIPTAYVGEAYDLSALVVAEEGVTYAYTATYTDPENGQVQELKVKRDKITPKAEADISVTVTATRGEQTTSLQVVVPIHISADALDRFLSSDGIAGQADSGVTKTVIKDAAYLQSETSISSLEISFSDSASGTALLELSHHALHPYYTAQIWRNAALSFWVYNPTQQEVTFKLAAYDAVNGLSVTWDSPENTQFQTALPGQWTNLVFSLYDLGINKLLYSGTAPEQTAFLKLLARSNQADTCTIYLDDLDIVHADTVEGLITGYTEVPLPQGNYNDLLGFCTVSTQLADAILSPTSSGNGGKNAYRFGSNLQLDAPTFQLQFPSVTDISGFDYLSFDVCTENCKPYVSASILYLDSNGEIQKAGTSFSFPRNQWRTLYLNLSALKNVDLTKAVGISFGIQIDSEYQAGTFNGMYFDNVRLYDYSQDEPQMAPATLPDHDIISGPLSFATSRPNNCGVCQVSTDETGKVISNSTLVFWANHPSGYPTATFMFDNEQDWSSYSMLSFETHQVNAHYWMQLNVIYLDEFDNQHMLTLYHDTSFNHWMTNNIPMNWFKTAEGTSPNPEALTRVIGFKITVDLTNNLTSEVGYIFFDNFELS